MVERLVEDQSVLGSSPNLSTKKEVYIMTIQEKLEKYKEEHCSKCNKNIDCKIILENGEIYCTEEE